MSKMGERTRFMVEVRPGETTIVSWKKLIKDAFKAQINVEAHNDDVAAPPAAVPEVAAPNALEARLAPVPVQPAANEDATAPTRFSSVIEKIERLYMGKDSSDEEDPDGVPDDDQYDTEDSFIDDAELDEYFEVDKSKTKHDGYFVNRGALEKVIEPSQPANHQPKKRRRKETAKGAGNNDDGPGPSKHMKQGKNGSRKSLTVEKGVLPTSEGPSVKCSDEIKLQNNLKIAVDSKPLLDPSVRISHDDGSLTLAEISEIQKIGIFPPKSLSSNLKEASGTGDKIESMHKSHSPINNAKETEIVIHQKDKSTTRERIDLNLPDTMHSMQPVKNSVTRKKESSSSKSKANVLEKAVRDLEKMVAESRPPALDAQPGDSSVQCIKRRLPREIKQKLAKVARLAHASNGNVSNELLSRLMGFLGHLCQVRTLKRHLKIMVTTSLSAKQEKDNKFQVIKKEVVEMVKTCVPSLISKATEEQSGGSVDMQEASHSEIAAKKQLFMDATLEDKICDLYDIFVDGLDEDAAPQVRKLYAELAELWPKGTMDNHGIKRAICRAKERRRALDDKNKDLEKIRRKNVVVTNTEGTVRMEPNIAAQSQEHNQFSSTTNVGGEVTVMPINTAPIFTSSTSLPISDGPIQKNVKVSHSSSLSDARITDVTGISAKKKVKKRASSLDGEMTEIHMREDKFSSHQADDRRKQQKHPAASVQGGSH